MAQESPLSATGNLSEEQYEWLASPTSTDGLIGHPNDPEPVTVSGAQLVITPGLRGVLRGFPWASGATPTTHSPDLTGPARTDLLALRLERPDGYEVATGIRTGVPGAGAPAPYNGTGAGDLYDIPLAEYDIANGAITAVRRRAWYLGEDGQILCKASTRPPHAVGRVINEVDTGRRLLSDGNKWTATLDDSGVTSVQVLSGFSATENGLQRRSGVCVLNLKVLRTNAAFPAGSTTKVANLPAGFEPTFPVQSAAQVWAQGQPAALRVTSAGVYVVALAGVSVGEDRTVEGSLTWFVR